MKKQVSILILLVFLFFILSVIFGCGQPTTTTASAGSGVTDPSNSPSGNDLSSASYIGSLACQVCHASEYTEWAATAHNSVTHATSSSCIRCHGTGYGSTGGVVAPATNEAQMAGIQCEACHGPGSLHQAAATSEKSSTINKTPSAESTCGTCHYMRKMLENSIDLDDSAAVQAKVVALLTGSGTTNYHPMHHGPNLAAGKGVGGYEYDGTAYTSSSHFSLVSNSCATCHLQYAAGSNAKSVTAGNHDLAADILACQQCHTGTTTLDVSGKQTEIANLTASLKAELATYEAAVTKSSRTSESYVKALWNYKFISEDLSEGVHNYKYFKQLLNDSINNFDPNNP